MEPENVECANFSAEYHLRLAGPADTDALVVELFRVQAGLFESQDRRRHAELNVAAHDFEVAALTLEPFRFGRFVGQLLDLAADAARNCAIRQERDRSDPAAAGFERRLERLQTDAHRADNAQAGDDHSLG